MRHKSGDADLKYAKKAKYFNEILVQSSRIVRLFIVHQGKEWTLHTPY